MFSKKDEQKYKRKSRREEEINLKEIADIFDNAFNSPDPDSLFMKILRDKWETDKEHHDNHEKCEGFNTPKETEKRICHCMYYYGKSMVQCERVKCQLIHRWKNVGNIGVTEFEIPTKYVMKGVGGIDLILDDHYAVEVKPPQSINPESVSRMFLEILTYTVGRKDRYSPGIMVFNGSSQWKMINDLLTDENESIIRIMKYIAVFVADYEYKGNIAEYRITQLLK